MPVDAYRLVSMLAGGATVSRRLDSPMIGRLRQRRLLAEAFEQVVDERVCHLFSILGAAGVGKSRLVNEFLASLGDTAQVLHGRCLSYGEGITFWPISEAVREAAGLTEEDDDDAVRAKIGSLIDDERDRMPVVERIGTLARPLRGERRGGGNVLGRQDPARNQSPACDRLFSSSTTCTGLSRRCWTWSRTWPTG